MNDGSMADGYDGNAARQARIGGLCYLVVIAGGVFAQLFVREPLFIAGNAEATADAIATNETLWRLGIAVHLLYLPAAAAADVILYRLLRRVSATLALLALILSLADIAMEAVLLTQLSVPLEMMRESAATRALSDQERHALGYLAIRLFFTGWNFALLLFSGFCALIGILILRSHLMPRVIGVLMIGAGIGYFVNSVIGILSPGVAARLVPWILLPCFIGELSLALWLTVKGVREGDRVVAVR